MLEQFLNKGKKCHAASCSAGGHLQPSALQSQALMHLFFSCFRSPPPPPQSSSEGFGVAEKIVLLTFISAVILMAILGNLLVMVAVCRDRQLR